MKHVWRVLAGLYILALVLSLSGNLKALPEYGTHYGQSCQLCHVSATGGGMRNGYGAQFFSYTELPVHTMSFDALDSLQASLGDKIRFGFDFRDLYYYSRPSNSPSLDQNSFVTMEGNFYVAFTPSDHAAVVFEKGLYNGYEAYAQINAGLGKPFVKVGHFMPYFGWQVEDHRTFTRRFTGFGGETGVGNREDGIEGGVIGEHWELTGAVTNGASVTSIDPNTGKAVTMRAASRFKALGIPMTVGTNWRYLEFGKSAGPISSMGGVFYGLDAGPVTWLGEADVINQATGGYAWSNLLSWKIKQGWYLKQAVDVYTPDRSISGNEWYRSRTALTWVPTGYLSIEPGIEYLKNPIDKTLTADVMMHLWY